MRKTLTLVILLALATLAGPAAAGDAVAPFFPSASAQGSFLGVELSDLDDVAAAELGLRGAAGVRVDRVTEDSAAAEAGLEAGDVVLAFDGERVRSASHLGRLVRETAAGRTVELLVLREGRERGIEAKLRERSLATAWFAPRPPSPSMPALPPMPAHAPDASRVHERFLPFLGGPSWRLGIQADDLGGQLAQFFEVEQGDGVLVEQVVEGSAAEKAGLRSGDVIVGIDEDRIHSLSGLRRLLSDDERSAAASLLIVRKGRERSLAVELDAVERPAAPAWFGGDSEDLSEWRERNQEQAEAWAAQAEQLRGQQQELRRELEENARRLRDEAREQQRELQRQLRDAQRSLRFAAPAPTAMPSPGPAASSGLPAGLPL